MKAKITKLDPCGCVIDEQEFELPLVDCGISTEYTSIAKHRFTLQIGEYIYYLYNNGHLDQVGHEKQ